MDQARFACETIVIRDGHLIMPYIRLSREKADDITGSSSSSAGIKFTQVAILTFFAPTRFTDYRFSAVAVMRWGERGQLQLII